MAGSIHEEFSYLCRLCAAKINALLGVMIFEKTECGRQIDVKIRTCLPIQIHETDQLPKMVCEECGYKLDLLYEFRQKSINTEHILLNLIKEINSTVGNCESIELLEHKSHPETGVILPDSEQLQIQNSHSIQEHHYITDTQELTNSIVNQNVIVHQNEIILTQQTLELTDQSLQLTHENFTINPNDIQTVRNEDIAIPVSLEQVRHAQELDIATDGITVQEQLNTTDMCDDLIENEQYGVKCENFDDQIKNEMKQAVSDTEIDESAESTDDPDYDQRTDDEEFKDEKASLDYHMTEEKLQEFLVNVNIQSVIADDGKEIVCYFCTLCAQMYEDKDTFKSHYENHWIKCDKCTLLLKNESDLNVHRKQLHKRRTRSRNKDNLDCKYETEIDEDDQAEINENNRSDETKPEDTSVMRRKRWEPKVCSECGKSYRTNYKLNEHMRKHTGEKPYRCHTCEKGFRSKIGLAQHEAKHTGVYDFFCTICGKGFQCRSYLTVHQRVHSDAKPYPCNTCGRNFKTKQSLLDHMNRHLGVKPYMCDICGRGFITKGLCKSHQKVHSGMDNRQYPCEVCNKMFVSKSYLTTHQRIHTGEKPFVCNVCNKGFLTRVDLRIHTTMHTGEKSFVCEMCGKAFARRDALRCHRRSHTGERPYRCDICGQSFTQFSPMAIHKRLHTGERPYECDVCSKTFVSRSTMMSHRAKKHSKI